MPNTEQHNKKYFERLFKYNRASGLHKQIKTHKQFWVKSAQINTNCNCTSIRHRRPLRI